MQRKRKFQYYVFASLLVALSSLFFVACSKDDMDEEPDESQIQLINEGDEMISQILVNDRIVEELEEEVVNMGTKELPALFFIRKSHRVNGNPVTLHNVSDNAYRSVSLEDLERFILLWCRVFGFNILTSDEVINRDNRAEAYYMLAAYLRENKLDPALLFKLAEREDEDLKALVELIDESQAVVTRSSQSSNHPNQLLMALDQHQITAKSFIQSVEANGLSLDRFMAGCESAGVNIPATFSFAQTKGAISVIKGIVKGVEIVSKILIYFIEHGAPTVDFKDYYASFLHEQDLQAMNYVGSKENNSNKYEVRYGSKKSPLASAAFHVNVFHESEHATIPGMYIARVGMVVDAVRCSGAMHVEGRMELDSPFENKGSEAKPIASAVGTIWVDYGDCCCFSRHAYLNFRVSGDTGYEELTWTPKK